MGRGKYDKPIRLLRIISLLNEDSGVVRACQLRHRLLSLGEGVRTFKVECTDSVQLLGEEHEVPSDFDASEHLVSALGREAGREGATQLVSPGSGCYNSRSCISAEVRYWLR